MKRSRQPVKRKKAPKKLGGPSFAKEVGKDVLGKVAVWGVGIGAVYFLVLRPILQKVGIVQSKEDKEQEKQENEFSQGANSPFNPNYYKNAPAGSPLVTKAVATQIAQSIYAAHHWYNDNEEQVYGALRQLSYKTQLSWVADVFYQLYSEDMYTYMRSFLDDAEMSVVNGIAKNLK